MKSLSKKIAALEKSQTLALFARAKKMKSEGLDVISFTAGEPDFPTPQLIKEAGIEAIRQNFTKYTPNQGFPDLLKAIVEKFRRENNLQFETSQILVSSGAKQSVFNALQAICNRGDEVIIPAPYWVSYPEMVKLADAKPVAVKTSASNQFKMTAAQLKRALSKKSKALILNSPCNPTGAVYTRDELEELAKIIETSGMYVISDEIYEKVIFDGLRHFSIGSIKEISDQVITVNGVSKAYSMTGWRIGFMGAHRSIIEASDKLQGQVTSNASSISQKAAYAALANNIEGDIRAMVQEFDRRRNFLKQEFSRMKGIEIIEPKGAFYLFFNVKEYVGASVDGMKIRTSDDLCEYFLHKHLLAMVPGTGFGAKEWVRLSYACSMEELSNGVERLHRGFSELKS